MADNKESLTPPLPDSDKETYLQRLNRYFMLSLSLPERTARAASALVGGTTLLLTRTLIPSSLKNTNSYRFTLGMFQSFLIRNVAGIDSIETDTELKDRFVNRKILGTGLEAAGLLTMHLSPVWVFAIASDTAKGGQVFLQRLVEHLKAHDVIAEDARPQSIEQILEAIHEMGTQGAAAIDTPPMSGEEIAQLASELRRTTGSLAQNSTQLLPTFESLWDQITSVARKENLSVEQVLGMLSISAASLTRTGTGTAAAVSKTGLQILDEVVLTDYRDTLNDITETGSVNYLKTNLEPFWISATEHFDFRKETHTQRWFKNAIQKILAKYRVRE